jgi:hypothetical protein
MVFSSQNIDFPILFTQALGAFLFLPIFFFNTLSLSLSLFSMLRLFEELGILMINKKKNTLQKFLFRRNGIEWLSHDYRNGGVVNISAVNVYFGMELCTTILLGEASKKMDDKSFSEKIKTHNGHIP